MEIADEEEGIGGGGGELSWQDAGDVIAAVEAVIVRVHVHVMNGAARAVDDLERGVVRVFGEL